MTADLDIQRDVEEELVSEPSVDPSHIAVSVKAGIVTLEGHVPAYGEKCIAERAAARISGVKAVVDELDVKLLGRDEKSDEEIAAACVRALNTGYGVPAGSIRVFISNSVVTLEGQVDLQYKKEAVLRTAGYVAGVKDVVDRIEVRSPQRGAASQQPKMGGLPLNTKQFVSN